MTARLSLIVYISVTLVILIFTAVNFLLIKSNTSLKPYIIVSGSMEPLVPTGSLIYTKNKASYDIGEVITFLQDDKIVSHRIERTVTVGGEKYYSTKGDANDVTDVDLVASSDVLGSVTNVIPVIGSMLLGYRNPYGMFLGLIVPLALLLMVYFYPHSNRMYLRKA